jgi:hypothetical protein
MNRASVAGALRRTGLNSSLILAILAGGCAQASLDHSIASVGDSISPEAFEGARLAPLNARAHMATSLWLLGRAGGRPSDVELAKSGFQTAARLAPDMWEPQIGLAACYFRLGQFDDALSAFALAAERRGRIGDFAMPLALVAYRAHRPGLARLAYALAQTQGSADSAFLASAFAGSDAWHPDAAAVVPAPASATPDADRNVVIEAFIIRDGRMASSVSGLNLLDTLALNFAGTVVNFNRDAGGSTLTNNLQVTLPNLTYSLKLASRDLTRVTLEASPVVIARQGKTSKFLEGGSVLIVPSANGVQPIDKDVGLSLEVTPDRLGSVDVDLHVTLELSNITDRNLNNGPRTASVLETDKTHIEVAARVPFGKAMMIGSLGTLSRHSGDTRSLVAIPLPGFSTRGAQATRRDVVVLISVRRADDEAVAWFDEAAMAKSLFGQPLITSGSYGERPSDTPDPQLERLLMSVKP